MHPVLCTNAYHDIMNLVNHGMVKNTKTWISWEWNITFLQNKRILNLCFRQRILRSYCFVAEVTVKYIHIMTKVTFSTENNYSKLAAKIWQYIENHA